MVKIKSLLFLLLISSALNAQQFELLDLDQARALSLANYPLIKERGLLAQSTEIRTSNLEKQFLPQLSFLAQATYQSDVTKVTIPIPGFNIEPPGKDQYRVVADVNQLIYDGGAVKQQKVLQQLNNSVEQQKLEVEFHKLKERVDQLYLSVLYLDAQAKQVELIKSDIQVGIKRVEAQVQNGVAFRSNLDVLKAELIKAEQRAIEIRNTRKGYVNALKVYTGQQLSDTIKLKEVALNSTPESQEIKRPELKLFSEQEKLINHEYNMIAARNLPKASVFAQGGYGRPGLNMLNNNFDFYYIGGLRLNWSLSSLYTKKKDRELVEVNKKIVDIQREQFVLNTNQQLEQQRAELNKLGQLIASDNEIISLRESVTKAAKAQLENGVITANDYLREINAEDQARQMLITHQLQLMQAQINYHNTLGN